jgi:hypothetical protein
MTACKRDFGTGFKTCHCVGCHESLRQSKGLTLTRGWISCSPGELRFRDMLTLWALLRLPLTRDLVVLLVGGHGARVYWTCHVRPPFAVCTMRFTNVEAMAELDVW